MITLTQEDYLDVFRKTEALLEGHFLLTSGLHSNVYFQCAKVLQFPWYSEKLCQGLSAHFRDMAIDTVITPAVGGIVVGQELARQLNVRSIFTERQDGTMTLRRGFEIAKGEKFLVAEDVTTTGGSVREVIEVVRDMGGMVQGVAAIVDRSGGKKIFDVPYFSLVQLAVENHDPETCPLCKDKLPLVKPGSRNLKV